MLTPNMRKLLAERFALVDDEFTSAVLDGLSRPQKSLPCRFFYDARGSALFEEITRLPEYYPTRTEAAILEAHAAEMTEGIADGSVLVELGSGSSLKTETLLRKLPRSCAYVPVDVSPAALEDAAAAADGALPAPRRAAHRRRLLAANHLPRRSSASDRRPDSSPAPRSATSPPSRPAACSPSCATRSPPVAD